MVASRHMHQYGSTPEQLAEIAVTTRYHAMRNPQAVQAMNDLLCRISPALRQPSDGFGYGESIPSQLPQDRHFGGCKFLRMQRVHGLAHQIS